MAYTKQAKKRYLVEMLALAALIIGASRLRLALGPHIAPALALALKLVPVAGVALIAVIILRLYRGRDEFQRAQMLKGAALGGLFAFVGFVTYPMLVQMGAPPMSSLTAVLIMSAAALGGELVMKFLQEQQESGSRAAALGKALMVPASLLVPPLAYWLLSLVMALPPLTFQHGLLYGGCGCIAYAVYRTFIRPTE